MDTNARRKAQQRVDRIALFRQELAELEREQVLALTPQQRARLDSHFEEVLAQLTRRFGADATESAKRISWVMRVAVLLGGAALVAAAVLFLHRVWGAVPFWGQATILTTVPLLLLTAAEIGFRRRVDLYYVALLSLTAGAAFVMGLDGLRTVCNLEFSPHFLFAWGGFAVLTAYAFGLRLLLGAGLVLLCTYAAAIGMIGQGWFWDSFMERTELFLPAAAVCYAIPRLGGGRDSRDFSFVYRICGAALGLTALLILSISGHLSWPWIGARAGESVLQLIGLALSVGVVFHGLCLGRSGLVNLGAAGFTVFLYARLHAWCWNWMPKFLFFLLIGVAAILLAVVFWRLRKRVTERASP